MFFQDLKEEKEFDAACSAWLKKYRHPGTSDLAKVLQRACRIGGFPCASLFERAYRELHAEGEVALVMEKLVEPVVTESAILTAEEYRKIPASQVARRYMADREFKKSVDRLIARKEI